MSDEEIVGRVGILTQQTHVVILSVVGTHELIEDVVIPLDFQLKGDARLFQQISLDICRGNFVGRTKVDANELAL